MKTYMFMYILGDDIDTVTKNLGQHVRYWKDLGLEYYKNGPFADKSGGLIIFTVTSHAEAERILAKDPLIKEKAIEQYWLKEWVA